MAADLPEKSWSPYADRGEAAFWRSAVGKRNPLEIRGLWRPKYDIQPTDRIATAGSCFAQHISRALQRSGYRWYNAEPAPTFVDQRTALEFSYGVYSFRTGNIYTAGALRQWVEWAFSPAAAPALYWRDGDRFFDPFRPAIEPGGFASVDELLASRSVTLRAIVKTIKRASLFVFTLGLTEGWRSRTDGAVYAMCPGTLAGSFDDAEHEFHNFAYDEIRASLLATIKILRKRNASLRILLTVSPVPLTATATDEHVLVATTHSKSVLRAVAGSLADEFDYVDYFPSYEIITGIPFRSMFFESNLRTVTPQGVEFVMKAFFAGLEEAFGSRELPNDVTPLKGAARAAAEEDEIVCEERMLEAFGPAT